MDRVSTFGMLNTSQKCCSVLRSCVQSSALAGLAAVNQALHAGVGVMTSIGRLDCATLVLDGYLPVHPGRAGAMASVATLVVQLREGRAAAACAGGAFAGGSASTDVVIRCGADNLIALCESSNWQLHKRSRLLS